MGLPDSWPGPCDLAAGLPWTSHDLYADPYWENMDRDTFDALSYALFPLIMSYFHTGNATHGARAVHLLRVYVGLSSRSALRIFAEKIQSSSRSTEVLAVQVFPQPRHGDERCLGNALCRGRARSLP